MNPNHRAPNQQGKRLADLSRKKKTRKKRSNQIGTSASSACRTIWHKHPKQLQHKGWIGLETLVASQVDINLTQYLQKCTNLWTLLGNQESSSIIPTKILISKLSSGENSGPGDGEKDGFRLEHLMPTKSSRATILYCNLHTAWVLLIPEPIRLFVGQTFHVWVEIHPFNVPWNPSKHLFFLLQDAC